MATFGEKIKHIRVERSMTQDDLASLLHTTKQVISNYERDLRSPKLNIAVRYSSALNVPLSYLINDGISIVDHPELLNEEETAAPKDDGLSPYDVQLMDYLRLLTDDQKRFLLAQIKTLLSTQE